MDTTILVERHINDGKHLLRELFNNKWKIKVAFWNKNERSNEWKLYLAIPILKEEGSRSIYLKLTKRIISIQPNLSIDIDDIVLLHSNDQVTGEIRNILSHGTIGNFQTKSMYLRGNQRISGESICYVLQNIR